MDLNRATVLGRLTRDPEVRTTTSGKSVTNITIATSFQWKDQSGERQEKSEFHDVVLWGRLGEVAGQYLAKGRRVYMEGRIETRDWTGQDGVKRYRTEIIGDNMIMFDGGRDGGAPSQDNAPARSTNTSPEEVVEEVKVEDIPF